MIKLIILFAWVLATPWLVGRLMLFRSEKWNGNPLQAYIAGLLLELAWFELLAVPFSLTKRSLSELVLGWCLPILAACVWSLWRHHDLKREWSWLTGMGGKIWLMCIPFLIIFALQAGYITDRQHVDDDDANYVVRAVVSVETDTLYQYSVYTGNPYKGVPRRYVLAPWPLVLAALAKISSIHPTIIAHMIIPMILLFWVYLSYARMGAVFYPEDREKQILFLTLTAVLLTFTGFSVYSSSTFMWVRSWQGKAVLAGMGIPLLLTLLYPIYEGKAERNDWQQLFLAMICCCLFSSMGVVLGGVICGVGGLMSALAGRSWKTFVCSMICCLPVLVCGMVYLLL